MHIRIITTGGTIDKIYFDALSEYEVGPPQIEEILRDMAVCFTYEVESILRKDSLEMTDEDRRLIRTRIEGVECPLILITHGTDTMIQTARMLQGIPGKTIVLTGSLQPARFRITDAPFNVGCAIGALQSLPPGAYIAMNGKVFYPDRVRKNRERHCFEEV